jgi:hypothetical protein
MRQFGIITPVTLRSKYRNMRKAQLMEMRNAMLRANEKSLLQEMDAVEISS